MKLEVTVPKMREQIGYDAREKNIVSAGQKERGGTETALPIWDRLPGGCPPCWDRLEQLDWTAGLAFVSHGARIGIRVTEAAVLERIPALLPPGWQMAASPTVDSLYSLKVATPSPRPDVRRYHMLYQGIDRLARTHDLEEALAALQSDLHTQVAECAREHLFVHAGVIGWNGKAVVIPGRTFSGKSSLVAALVRAGATYFSDEYAVFDADGCVHPYAKPLSLRDEDGRPHGACSVADLGGVAATEPLPVGMIVSARYEAGARWRPRPLSPGRAMLTLLDNTVQVRRQPQAAMQTLQKAALGTEAFQSKRGEADQVAAWLRKRPLSG
ncbi:MAG: hypothetical protein M3Y13_09150 [Armatimonadota bacterium]|nr:hypothetical protein [Armatimonadota bacterium]